jgi:hypothetical protein
VLAETSPESERVMLAVLKLSGGVLGAYEMT